MDTDVLYRHGGVALLRAAAVPLAAGPWWWPNPADTQSCRAWLGEVWAVPQFADAVRHASPTLADRVDAVREGRLLSAKQLRRAALATARYVMRVSGRPTPFGLFAGVTAAQLGPKPDLRWGQNHRAVARVDTQWLADVIDIVERCPELLDRLDVVFNDLAVRRGPRLEAPHGPSRVSIRFTAAVRAVRDAATSPMRFGALTGKLVETFHADPGVVRAMLTDLVRQGLLITELRPPMTVVDPLAHLLRQLDTAETGTHETVRSLYGELSEVHRDLYLHNQPATARAQQARVRAAVVERMRGLSQAGRTPLAVDLQLDCAMTLPTGVARELERAAAALLRLTRSPAGGAAWREFHTTFCDRYGTGTLVPLTEAVDPDTGIGLPAGYPGSLLPTPAEVVSDRDERLLALAWRAVVNNGAEVVLTDETIAAVTDGDGFLAPFIPPHVEMAARIHADNVEALRLGEYSVTVSPARAAGTLTSRFTATATGCGLQEVYCGVPTVVEGALPVQLSMPPVYPHSENVSRIPAYLPHVLSLGEHRRAADHDGRAEHIISLDDLALTADHERLYLVSVSRQRVIEPQVFHALAVDKQLPPLGRFLAHIPRAFTARWHEFDWGPHAHRMPYLPRVRYGRTVIAPARWRLTAADLPTADPTASGWQQALHRWRLRWRCPDTVELRDPDRTLRLTFTEPIHLAILHAHVRSHGDATFTEAAPPEAFGWIGGHVHEIAVPLTITRPGAPAPRIGGAPLVTRDRHGHLPGASDATWLTAKIFTHPERIDEILTAHLPGLFAAHDAEPAYWFVRYRSPHETDHLRLRLHAPDAEQFGRCAAAIGEWTRRLRSDGVAGRLVLDTYHPEVGRYGHGPAMRAAEAVFVADSRAVVASLRHRPAVDPTALVAAGMVDLVGSFLGDRAAGMRWLTKRPTPTVTTRVSRTVTDQAITLVRHGGPPELPGPVVELGKAWQDRANALNTYKRHLPPEADIDAVLESLLHMHHNRALGINPDGERACRRIARQAALAWQAHDGSQP